MILALSAKKWTPNQLPKWKQVRPSTFHVPYYPAMKNSKSSHIWTGLPIRGHFGSPSLIDFRRWGGTQQASLQLCKLEGQLIAMQNGTERQERGSSSKEVTAACNDEMNSCSLQSILQSFIYADFTTHDLDPTPGYVSPIGLCFIRTPRKPCKKLATVLFSPGAHNNSFSLPQLSTAGVTPDTSLHVQASCAMLTS